jgi:formylglycine-generating enzyme required for sulfatase activity
MKQPSFAIFVIVCILLCSAPLFAQDVSDMVLIPGGTFIMGDMAGDADERPPHEVSVDAFFIDKFEVTNSDFAAFLNERGNRETEGVPWILTNSESCRIKAVGGGFEVEPGYEDHPVVMVNFSGAEAFAHWAGKRLPTEAEWERAARGGLEDAPYPWGDDLDTTRANYDRKRSGTTPVGIYPPNGFGLFDMAGNVSELVSDWYEAAYYRNTPSKNPGGPLEGTTHTVRGGDWASGPDSLTVYARNEGAPPYRSLPTVGFRCARDAR